jgi:hypothetical protein
MAESIGHWLGSLPDWLQMAAIPLFVLLALLFIPAGGSGEPLGAIILDVMTRNLGGKNDEK